MGVPGLHKNAKYNVRVVYVISAYECIENNSSNFVPRSNIQKSKPQPSNYLTVTGHPEGRYSANAIIMFLMLFCDTRFQLSFIMDRGIQ